MISKGYISDKIKFIVCFSILIITGCSSSNLKKQIIDDHEFSKIDCTVINNSILDKPKINSVTYTKILFSEDKNYKKVGEFEVVNYLDINEIIIPELIQKVSGLTININALKRDEFYEKINKTIAQSDDFAKKYAKTKGFKTIMMFGRKTSYKDEYKQNVVIISVKKDKNNYLYSKYYYLVDN